MIQSQSIRSSVADFSGARTLFMMYTHCGLKCRFLLFQGFPQSQIFIYLFILTEITHNSCIESSYNKTSCLKLMGYSNFVIGKSSVTVTQVTSISGSQKDSGVYKMLQSLSRQLWGTPEDRTDTVSTAKSWTTPTLKILTSLLLKQGQEVL